MILAFAAILSAHQASVVPFVSWRQASGALVLQKVDLDSKKVASIWESQALPPKARLVDVAWRRDEHRISVLYQVDRQMRLSDVRDGDGRLIGRPKRVSSDARGILKVGKTLYLVTQSLEPAKTDTHPHVPDSTSYSWVARAVAARSGQRAFLVYSEARAGSAFGSIVDYRLPSLKSHHEMDPDGAYDVAATSRSLFVLSNFNSARLFGLSPQGKRTLIKSLEQTPGWMRVWADSKDECFYALTNRELTRISVGKGGSIEMVSVKGVPELNFEVESYQDSNRFVLFDSKGMAHSFSKKPFRYGGASKLSNGRVWPLLACKAL